MAETAADCNRRQEETISIHRRDVLPVEVHAVSGGKLLEETFGDLIDFANLGADVRQLMEGRRKPKSDTKHLQRHVRDVVLADLIIGLIS